MSPIRLNQDGSFPTWQDEAGRRHPTSEVEDLLEGGGDAEHPDLAAHAALGLAEEHTHPYSADDHDHSGVYAASGHGHASGEAFPVGSVFIAVVSTNPGTLLGYGTWTAFGAGRVLVGIDAGQTEFDTVEETGGAKTHTLTSGEMPSHTHTQDAHTHTQNSHNHTQDAHTHTQNSHAHAQQRFPTATGGSTGFTVDTSMSGTEAAANNTAAATATNQNATATNQAATATNQNATATNQTTGGGSAHNNLQPYIVVYMWKRTA